MNKYLIKIGLFFAFCILSVIIIACSDEFVSSNLRIGDEIATTSELEKVSGFDVVYGYRDTVPLIILSLDGNTEIAKSNVDSTDLLRPYKNALKRTRQFNLKWNSVNGAVGYELRVYPKPINESNWQKAQALEILELNEVDGKINALVTLNPVPDVKSGRCTGCGKCSQVCPTGAITVSGGKASVDLEKCIECGECFRGCEFEAITGTFAGSTYYLGIRSLNENDEYSEEIATYDNPIKIRYAIVSEIPNAVKYEKSEILKTTKGGCSGNCSFEGCFIAFPLNSVCKSIDKDLSRADNAQLGDSLVSVCPVDAIYEIDSSNVDTTETFYGAIYIDKDKCINCGRCVMQCWADGPYGAVTTEVVKAVSKFF